jgi:hypothetical protein
MSPWDGVMEQAFGLTFTVRVAFWRGSAASIGGLFQPTTVIP